MSPALPRSRRGRRPGFRPPCPARRRPRGRLHVPGRPAQAPRGARPSCSRRRGARGLRSRVRRSGGAGGAGAPPAGARRAGTCGPGPLSPPPHAGSGPLAPGPWDTVRYPGGREHRCEVRAPFGKRPRWFPVRNGAAGALPSSVETA